MPPKKRKPLARKRANRRRTVLVVITVFVLAIGLAAVGAAVRSGNQASTLDGPTRAAQDWMQAHLDHDDARFAELSCDGADAKIAGFDQSVNAQVTSVAGLSAASTGTDTWSVDLALSGPSGDGSYTATVHRTGGAYLVC